ncbi:MAG: transposase [Verrucomicrobia bacterium]|nr:transposase [Verrucomicrobiota bacterium]
MSEMEHPWATVGRGRGGIYAWFDPSEHPAWERGTHLPHWRQDGVLYFLTIRLADSFPAERLRCWRTERHEWLALHPRPHTPAEAREYHRRFTAAWHRLLDEPHGACPFKIASLRDALAAAFRAGEDLADGCALDEFVIMPNHAHVLVSPRPGVSLKRIEKAWKAVSARAIHAHFGTTGPVWQHEGWDHIVRTPEAADRFRRYIRANPASLPRPADG